MSRLISVAAAIAVIVTAIAVWSKFMVVKPEAAVPAASGMEESPSIMRPFDVMLKHGKELPQENWGPAN